jgi:aspartate aminotransferase
MGGVRESATMAVDARAKQLAAEGKTIYNLTAGELATDTPDYIQAAVAKKLHLNKYTPPAGLSELRREIAASSREFYGLDWIKPANVVATASTKPAMYASLLALVNRGDEVILPTPAWPTHNHLIELAGGTVVEVPLTDDFDLDADAIAARITSKTKAVVLNSPHNPTGAVFSKAALTKLADRLRGQAITIIADDIYVKLVYDKAFTPVSTCGFEHLVIINGFSKSQALTGWRIGYLIADEVIAKAAASLLSHITGNAPVPSQHAALAALERGDRPPATTITSLKRQRQLVDDELKRISGLKYHLPGGAFYFFLDLRGITKNSLQWCEDLLNETGVVLVPGEAFGAPGFARLTFTAPEPTLKKALRELQKFIAGRRP